MLKMYERCMKGLEPMQDGDGGEGGGRMVPYAL